MTGGMRPSTAGPVVGRRSSSVEPTWHRDALEIVPGRLYWVSFRGYPRTTEDTIFFSIDDTLCYEPFYTDFGPLNMGLLYRYCSILEGKFRTAAMKSPRASRSAPTKKIYHYCGTTPQRRSNAACLMAAFCVVILGWTPQEAIRPFEAARMSFMPFRDASMGPTTYHLTILDVCRALHRGIGLGWLNMSTFPITEYEHYERVENGDMNVLIPDKFIAFSGPRAEPVYTYGFRLFTPSDYIPIFKKYGVTDIIRLNKKVYDANDFKQAGFNHHELFFVDGSTPSPDIVRRFMDICENAKGVVAVHCKAGLGRTGTLIGLYMMKHYGFTPPETIGWLRVNRPGSVIGPQQHFLEHSHDWMVSEGDTFRRRHGNANHRSRSEVGASSLHANAAVEDPAMTLGTNSGRKIGMVSPASVVAASATEQLGRRKDSGIVASLGSLTLNPNGAPGQTTPVSMEPVYCDHLVKKPMRGPAAPSTAAGAYTGPMTRSKISPTTKTSAGTKLSGKNRNLAVEGLGMYQR
eukprot:Clim_evm88s156 gene=Clim_evmTU88s156